MTTDPDKLLRIAHAHVTMATDLAAAIVRAGERRAATLAAGGVLDLADAVFAIDCLAAHITTNEAMLRATEGDYPAESAARAQTMNRRLAEAVSEARAGLERGDDPLLVHTRLKIVLAMAAFASEQLRIDTAVRVAGAEQPDGSRPVVRALPRRLVSLDLGRDLSRVFRGRLTHADQRTSAPVMLDPDAVQAGVFVTAHGTPIEYDDTPGVRQCERVVTDGPMVAILPSADGAPVVRDLVLNAEGRWSEGDFTTLSEDDGEP